MVIEIGVLMKKILFALVLFVLLTAMRQPVKPKSSVYPEAGEMFTFSGYVDSSGNMSRAEPYNWMASYQNDQYGQQINFSRQLATDPVCNFTIQSSVIGEKCEGRSVNQNNVKITCTNTSNGKKDGYIHILCHGKL